MNPSIVTAHEVADHAVRVLVSKRSEHHFACFHLAVAVGVCKPVDIRNTERDSTVVEGEDADWNVQRIADRRKLVSFAIAVGVFNDRKLVGWFSTQRWKWVLERL